MINLFITIIYFYVFSLKAAENGDVVVACPVYNVDTEPREIFFFREGAVVFWNCTELEASNVLQFIKR